MLIEDSTEDAELIQECSMPGATIISSKELTELASGLNFLQEDTFDVVLLDLGLPDGVSLDALVQIRDQESELPIGILAGLSDKKVAVKAMALGSQNCLVKGKSNADSLELAISYSIKRQQLEAERKKLTDAVPALSSHIDRNYRYISINKNMNYSSD